MIMINKNTHTYSSIFENWSEPHSLFSIDAVRICKNKAKIQPCQISQPKIWTIVRCMYGKDNAASVLYLTYQEAFLTGHLFLAAS